MGQNRVLQVVRRVTEGDEFQTVEKDIVLAQFTISGNDHYKTERVDGHLVRVVLTGPEVELPAPPDYVPNPPAWADHDAEVGKSTRLRGQEGAPLVEPEEPEEPEPPVVEPVDEVTVVVADEPAED